jgi:hypothetical protein
MELKQYLESQVLEYFEARDVGLRSTLQSLPRKLKQDFESVTDIEFESVFGVDDAELRVIVQYEQNLSTDQKLQLIRDVMDVLKQMGADNVNQHGAERDSFTVSIRY